MLTIDRETAGRISKNVSDDFMLLRCLDNGHMRTKRRKDGTNASYRIGEFSCPECGSNVEHVDEKDRG